MLPSSQPTANPSVAFKIEFTYLPYIILLVFAEFILVALVCFFCTWCMMKRENSAREFTFGQTFESSLLRTKTGAIILCTTRMVCFIYFLVADVIINEGFVHATLPQYFTTWNCELLVVYFLFASISSVIGLLQYDAGEQKWSPATERFGYVLFVLFEVCGGTAFLVTVVAFGLLNPHFEFWNASVHFTTTLSMLLELTQNSMYVQLNHFPFQLFWFVIYCSFIWPLVAIGPRSVHYWPYFFMDVSTPFCFAWYTGVFIAVFILYALFYGLSQVKFYAHRAFGVLSEDGSEIKRVATWTDQLPQTDELETFEISNLPSPVQAVPSEAMTASVMIANTTLEDFGVGARVEVDWMGQGTWHLATVEAIESNTLHVRYDDGRAEHFVPTQRVRLSGLHSAPAVKHIEEDPQAADFGISAESKSFDTESQMNVD